MERLTEFLWVLTFALAIGALAMLAIYHLSGTPFTLAVVALVIVTIGAWQYLRRRFGRR
ncbi:MAG: hypothetical protein ACYC2Y_00960 [Armatimonadota bacterium]